MTPDNDKQSTPNQPAAPKPTNGVPAAGNGGGRLKTLRNGAVYDLEAKRIVANPGGGTTAITQAKATEYHELSRQARLDAVYRGLAAGTGRSNAHDAVEAIVARQSELAMNIERGRASTEAARFAFQAGELIQDKRIGQDDGLTVTAHVSAGAIAALLARLDQDRDEIVDGQLVDVDGSG